MREIEEEEMSLQDYMRVLRKENGLYLQSL